MLPTKKSPRVFNLKRLTVCIYGRPKIGKSSLAAEFGDSVLFLATERGLSGLEVFQLEINAWGDFVGAIRDLATSDHGFETVVIDVVDELRSLALIHVEECDGLSVDRASQSARAYGKANKLIKEALQLLQLSGLGIVFLSHEKSQLVAPNGDIVGAFDRAPAGAREKVFPSVTGRTRELVLGMSDCIIRYAFDAKTGRRVFQAQGSKDVEAGERFNLLPATIDAGGSASEAYEALIGPFREAWKSATEKE